jgi:membrane peptidoglycan carboxypeptidase
VKTEFSTLCDSSSNPLNQNKNAEDVCYSPQNYDNNFRGPISLRNSLAQSLNVPSVKLLYLTGMKNAIALANKMGLSTINNPNRYGLSLVLGGGEVSLFDMVSAYGVFANYGTYTKPKSLLSIKSVHGDINDTFETEQKTVLSENTTELISSILSDNVARTPSYGPNSALYFKDRDVAVKTGTTNDYRDLWVIGYTPSLVIGMWAGNNDNTPVEKKVSGALLAPIWRKAMDIALAGKDPEYFKEPTPNSSTKPILRGDYCNEGKPDTILGILDKNNPLDPNPLTAVDNDPEYTLWRTPVLAYLLEKSLCGMSSSTPSFINQTGTTTIIEIPPTVLPQ